ncbi:MAG: UDP-glucose 4-epimerase GalE [Anaerocolumna sp.]
MKILVTGGAGFIGSHTCIELLQDNYEVIVLDNLCNSKYEAVRRVQEISGREIKFYQCDLRNQTATGEILKNEMPDAVIHFAGLKAVGESCSIPLQYYENNIIGTLNLLNSMKEYKIKNFIFSSSATVYGLPKALPIKEDSVLSVSNPYGRTKLMLEEILTDLYQSDSSWNIMLLRYFNPIGAHESGLIGEDPKGIPNNLLPFVAKVAIGELSEIKVFGNDYNTPDGTGVRDYIHVADLAHGHIKALGKTFENSGLKVYNLGTGTGYSVFDMIHNFEKVCGKKLPYKIVGRRTGDIGACYADPSKAELELGWKAARDIGKMCEDAWRWQVMNPEGYK